MLHVSFVTPHITLWMSLISDVAVVISVDRVVPQRLFQIVKLRILLDVDARALVRIVIIFLSESVLVQKLLQLRELWRHVGSG